MKICEHSALDSTELDSTQSECEETAPAADDMGIGGTPGGIRVSDIDAALLRASVSARLFGTVAEPLKIGRFTVLSRVGAGGMGVVYAGFDEALNRKVALKVLHTVDANPKVRALLSEQLSKEAQALARLSHPNVVQVYEVGEYRGHLFLAMEFLTGTTLRQNSDLPRNDWSKWLEPWIAAAKGLAAAHACGLVHRDFKPENAMRAADGTVKVLDFGLASDLDAPLQSGLHREFPGNLSASAKFLDTSKNLYSTQRTRSGQILGTPAYMAPEQYQGWRSDARSDQFSFCVALWEAVYGCRPFAGTSLAELAHNVCNDLRLPTPPLPSVPKWLVTLLNRGLAGDPNARYPSFAPILDELQKNRHANARRLRWSLSGVASCGLLWFVQAQTADPCAQVKEDAHARWNETTVDSLVATFKAAGLPQDSPAIRTLIQRLGDYAEQTKTREIAACQAVLVDQRQSLASYATFNSCLTRRTAAFNSLTQALIRGDAQVVSQALEATDDLPELSRCDPEQLSNVEQAPLQSEHERITLQTIDDLIAQADTQWALQLTPTSLDPINRALQLAQSIAHINAQARAHLARGHLQYLQHGYLASLDSFAKARELALRDGDHLLRINTYFGELTSVRALQDHERAKILLDEVKAALVLAGNPRDLHAKYLMRVSQLESAQHQPCAALGHLQEAVDLRRAIYGEHDHGIGDLWRRMGRIHALDLSRAAAAHPWFDRAYNQLVRELGPEHWKSLTAQEDRAWNLTDYARIVGVNDPLQARTLMERAKQDFAQVLAGHQASGTSRTSRLAWAHYNYGRLLHRMGELKVAKEHFELAKAKSEQSSWLLPDIGLIQVLTDLGERDTARENYEKLKPRMQEKAMAPYRSEVDFTWLRWVALDPDPQVRATVAALASSLRQQWQEQQREQERESTCVATDPHPVPAALDLQELAQWEAKALAD